MPGMLNRPHKKCRRSLHGLHGGKCRTVSNKLTLRFSKKGVTSFMSVPTVSCGCISDMPFASCCTCSSVLLCVFMWTGSGSSWLSWHLTVKWLEQLGLLQSWFLSLVTFRHFANLEMRVCVCVCCACIYIYMCVWFVKSFICLAFYISLTEPIALSQAEQVALNYLMMESAYSLNGLATRLRSIEHQQALLLQLLDSIAAIARQPQLQTADLV